jgi:mRNA interferase RelE/StbE
MSAAGGCTAASSRRWPTSPYDSIRSCDAGCSTKAGNPHRAGKSLRLQLAGLHSARRGDFRLIDGIDEANARIDILAIEHRSDVYPPR